IATQTLNAVLRIMQWGVIALIFLFFLRVIRAVWVEMSPATVRKPRSMRRQERRVERAAATAPRHPPPPPSPTPPPAPPKRRGAERPPASPPSQPRPSRRRQLYLKVVQPSEQAG